MAFAVLVVDMPVDFFAHARLTRNRAELVANVNELTRVARAQGMPVIWVKTEFEPDLRDAFLEVRRKAIRVAIRGSAGAALLPELDVADSDLARVRARSAGDQSSVRKRASSPVK